MNGVHVHTVVEYSVNYLGCSIVAQRYILAVSLARSEELGQDLKIGENPKDEHTVRQLEKHSREIFPDSEAHTSEQQELKKR